MLAFSIDYYGMIFRATQSVELFCAYGEASSHAAQSLNIIMLTYLECIKGMYATIEGMVITKWTDEIKRIYKEIEENLDKKI